MIRYQVEEQLDFREFITVLKKSGLSDRRPIDDEERIKKMVQNAQLIITARSDSKLIGVARSVTDFAYCTYLSDLAVDVDYQGQGIGTELIRRTKLASPDAALILLSAPAAISYYPKIGMEEHSACFILRDIKNLK
ncbi:MAG: GNAT family N-acetyltransferase [Balneolaceae bacterium]|nr:GNAT family N-acetyltransferase [Balneolaceae bacterium]